ncbi:putative coat protein [Magnaporthe oryzae virus 1]|uniref:Putative coat protein n=1 Tax=Magnaporthe oryzae virus 1 TaxID=271257 RepID=Q60GI3_9VIRU|nr:putative coat protein [Magnaporthe oryzae virus 1]BAD60832.1 putative coat protein [Magnaporthe oryzae virus 1]
MAQIGAPNFLSSVLGDQRGGVLNSDSVFRRYRAAITTSTIVRGVQDTRVGFLVFAVGRVFSSFSAALVRPKSSVPAIDATYPCPATRSEEFVGLAKKYSNFSSTFTHANFAGVVERLSRALAVLSTLPDSDTAALTSLDIAGGVMPTVYSIATFDSPVNALARVVFIPRIVDSLLSPNSLAVLIAAVAGEGSSVATDILRLDVSTRKAIVPIVSGPGLATAIVDALRVLASNMVEAGQGQLFSFAVTRGLHQALNVSSGTDGQYVMQSILRSGRFSPPLGGIHTSLPVFSGLPALVSESRRDVATFVDALALVSAAGAAPADPCIVERGNTFPTVLVSPGQISDLDSSSSMPGAFPSTPQLLGQLKEALPAFFSNYLRILSTVFAAGESDSVALDCACAFASLLEDLPTPLSAPTVLPFFWVEPTSLLPASVFSTTAESAGFGALATPGSPVTRPAWGAIEHLVSPSSAVSTATVSWTSARQNPFLWHFKGMRSDPLAAVIVDQFDPTDLAFAGPGGAETTLQKWGRQAPLTDYLWRDSASCLPAPGELLNLSGAIGLRFRHFVIDDNDDCAFTRIPMFHEIGTGSVTIAVSRPCGLAPDGPPARLERATVVSPALGYLRQRGANLRAFGRPDDLLAPRRLGPASLTVAPKAPPAPVSAPVSSFAFSGPKTSSRDPLSGELPTPLVPVQHYKAETGPKTGGLGAAGGGGGTVKPPTAVPPGLTEVPTAPDAGPTPEPHGAAPSLHE